MGKGKKNRKQDDDWENDLDEIAKEAGIETESRENDLENFTVTKKEKKKKKGKQTLEVEEENESLDTIEVVENLGKTKPSFSALAISDDDIEENDVDSPDESEEAKVEKKSKKKKDKKKGKAKEEDAEIENLLNELEIKETKETTSKKSKKKKKKDQAEVEVDDTEPVVKENEINDAEVTAEVSAEQPNVESSEPEKVHKDTTENENEVGSVVKTAAQKRAEKKEREKKKKEEEKKKAAKKKKKPDEDTSDASIKQPTDNEGVTDSAVQPIIDETQDNEKGQNDVEQKSDEEGEKDDSKEKKKKKKKKKDEETDKKKTKKPNKAAILKMQEALELAKKEEERLLAEEEAKQKAFEKAEEERLEKVKLEQERKEKKKQKEKERKERLKKEGKLLTAAQKEQKRKAEAMLEAMRQQGIIVPNKEDANAVIEKPKKVVYGKKKKQQPRQAQQNHNEEPPAKEETVVKKDEEIVQEPTDQNQVDEVKESTLEKKENVVDSWEAEEDIADSWDAEENVADSWDAIEDAKKKKSTEVVSAKSKETVKDSVLKKQVSQKSSEVEEDDGESSEDEEESSSEGETEDESSSEKESSSDEDSRLTPEKIKERARERIEKRRMENEAKRSLDKLRAPVICVLGHVDTGKTKILDKIRRTNVQDGEAGGITQQIGATNIPVEKVKEQTKMVKEFQKFDLQLPGLLIIDTPGHESFSNLRSRGSNLCDMAILVVDIMHGLEPQTIESINLLRKKQTPFVVALNKIDRLYEWVKSPDVQVELAIKKQKRLTKQEFDERCAVVINQLAEQGLNSALHYQNPDEKSYISLVPTSAHSGDGMGDLMAIICRLTQSRLAKKLSFSNELQCTVMEVKALPGLGTTIDAILVNGRLKEGDIIVTGGFDGAIVSQIRSVLTPQPMRELRVKAQYIHHQTLEAAQGVKLCAKDLDKVLAGSPLFVAQQQDEVEVLKDEVEDFVSSSLKAFKVSERGVYVQASTLGSLEALLEFLKTSKIPYCGVNIGPVHKKDIMRCSVMLEHEPLYAVVLAFDVKIERDAQEFADKEGVKIFSAEIIYHLFDQFTAYCEDYKEKKREEYKHLAVYPCKLRVLPEHIFNTRDPIVLGVAIDAGSLRLGTPIVVPSQNKIHIGFVTGIEANHKQLDKAFQNQDVCVKIEPVPGEAPRLFGRHFTHEDTLVSKITRESIDVMKKYFREDMSKSDWQLIIELKKRLDIV